MRLRLLSSAVLQSQDAGFPVKRVVLYKNGVGYFEHQGPVTGNQDVAISFTSGQLNDVLKSLTVLDLDGGRISGVGYGSSAPIDRQLGDLRLPIGEKTTLTEFLGALRGAKLEIRNGTTTVTGRLLSVERKTRMGAGATLEVDYVALMTDSGEVKTTEVSPSFSVRLLEKGLSGKVDRFLDLISSGREADIRRMVVSTEGTGQRSLFVSYISEVPVWKATYRVVLGAKRTVRCLQGWAIVDNTVGQDWNNVQLSLVAGAPQSFIQNLSQPYYSRRPTVALPDEMNISPQTYESTLRQGGAQIAGTVKRPLRRFTRRSDGPRHRSNGNVAGETRTDSTGKYELDVPEGDYRLEFQRAGFQLTSMNSIVATNDRPARRDAQMKVGSVSETITVTAEAVNILNTESASVSASGRRLGSGAALGGAGGASQARHITPPPPAPALSIDAARAQSRSAASGQELGDLFEYKLKDPVTIPKNRSALVPIVQSPIGAEKVSVWNESAGLPRPLRALWLNNTTGLTLDGGSIQCHRREHLRRRRHFRSHPSRRKASRLLRHRSRAQRQRAADQRPAEDLPRRDRQGRHAARSSEMRRKKIYTFRNEDSTSRTVIVEHPARAGYELRGDAQPDETTAAWMRFRLHVEPKQTSDLIVEESRPVQVRMHSPISPAIRSNSSCGSARSTKPSKKRSDKILAQKSVVEDLTERKDAGEEETSEHLRRPAAAARKHEIPQRQRRRESPSAALHASAERRRRPPRSAEKGQARSLETQIDCGPGHARSNDPEPVNGSGNLKNGK